MSGPCHMPPTGAQVASHIGTAPPLAPSAQMKGNAVSHCQSLNHTTCPGDRTCTRVGGGSPTAQKQPTRISLSCKGAHVACPRPGPPGHTLCPLGSQGQDLPKLGAGPHGTVGEGTFALSYLL